MKKTNYWKIAGFSTLYGSLFLILFGIVTVLIPNDFYVRMTPITFLDYVLFILTSFLLGTYTSLSLHKSVSTNLACDSGAFGGGVGGFVGFGCAICNKILVLLLGITGVLTYVEPYRPIIGFVGVGLLSYAVYAKFK